MEIIDRRRILLLNKCFANIITKYFTFILFSSMNEWNDMRRCDFGIYIICKKGMGSENDEMIIKRNEKEKN